MFEQINHNCAGDLNNWQVQCYGDMSIIQMPMFSCAKPCLDCFIHSCVTTLICSMLTAKLGKWWFKLVIFYIWTHQIFLYVLGFLRTSYINITIISDNGQIQTPPPGPQAVINTTLPCQPQWWLFSYSDMAAVQMSAIPIFSRFEVNNVFL